MKKLDYNDYLLCKFQGRVFEESLLNDNSSSSIFIRRFMNSKIAISFDNKSIIVSSIDVNGVYDLIKEEYGTKQYGSNKYNKNELYWIGYIYRVLSIYYNKSSKQIYKLFPANEIIKYYYIYHTFDPEYAAERMMENIGYDEDYDKRGLELLKKYITLDKLKNLLGKNVTVYIDRPINSYHPEHHDIIYNVNYGYIKEIVAADGEYQDAYVLGIDTPISECNGKVIAIVNRTNDNEDKLIVSVDDKQYTKDEIESTIEFQEKYFKHKIIMMPEDRK